MWSPPAKLEEDSELELAVKRSTWPPAHWVHTKAEVGSELSVKIGEIILDHLTRLLDLSSKQELGQTLRELF